MEFKKFVVLTCLDRGESSSETLRREMTLLRIYHSNRIEQLVSALTELLEKPAGGPADPEWIAVQGQGMRGWLAMELARHFGVCANIYSPFPRDLIVGLFRAALGDALPDTRPFAVGSMTWSIAADLPQFLDRPEFQDSPMTPEYNIDYTDSQLPVSDKWLYVDPVYPEIFPA